MAKYDARLTQLVDQALDTPQAKAFLDMIQAAEGGSFDRTFGNQQFTDFSKHPNKSVAFTDKTGRQSYSTAAGAYQILKSTWDDIAGRINANDFSERNQRRAALALAFQKPGMYQAIMQGDLNKIVNGANSIWTSLPNSAEGLKRHAVRSGDYITRAYNSARQSYGLPVVAGYQGSTAAGPVSAPVSANQNFFANMAMNSIGNSGSFYDRAMDTIRNKTWSNPGNVPFEMMNSNTGNRTVFGAPDLTNPQNADMLLNRLTDTDPAHQFGLSYTDNGLRPTVSVQDTQGRRVDMIENRQGNIARAYVDGQPVDPASVSAVPSSSNAPVSAPVVSGTPDPDLLSPALRPAPDALAPDKAIVPIQPRNNLAVSGGTSAAGDIPLPMNAAAAVPPDTPIAPVSLSQQLAATIGGDPLTRALNENRDPHDLARQILS